MKINRRCFMKWTGAVFCGMAAAGGIPAAQALAGGPDGSLEGAAMLNDVEKCIGCMSCVAACKKANDLPHPYVYSKDTNAEWWTTVKLSKAKDSKEPADKKVSKVKLQCMHCSTPSCTGVCPTGAAKKVQGGIVVLDQDICIGCKNCIVACPFNVPGYSEEKGTARKCEFCRNRLEKTNTTACAEACPTSAVLYGNREELLGIAAQRVGQLIAEGHKHAQVYGLNQLDGLKVLYVLPDLPENLGLPHSPKLANGDVVLKWAMGFLAAGFAVAAPLREIFRERPAESNSDTAQTGTKGVNSNDL